jgi:hypothetical protein
MKTPVARLVAAASVAVIALTGAPTAWSFDGDVTGTISVEITQVGNYSFRVRLNGSPAMCGNSNQWAYLSDGDSANYKTFVAALLAAKQAREQVRVWSNRDSSGFCKIEHVAAYSF